MLAFQSAVSGINLNRIKKKIDLNTGRGCGQGNFSSAGVILDETRIYPSSSPVVAGNYGAGKRALSAAEIAAIYNSTK